MFSCRLHHTYLEKVWFFTQQSTQHNFPGQGFTWCDFPKILHARRSPRPPHPQSHPETWPTASSSPLICSDYYNCEGLQANHIPEKFGSDNLAYGYKAVWKSVSAFDLRQSLTTQSTCYDFVYEATIILELCLSCIARKQLRCYHQNQNEGDLLFWGRWRIYAFPNSSCQVQLKSLH